MKPGWHWYDICDGYTRSFDEEPLGTTPVSVSAFIKLISPFSMYSKASQGMGTHLNVVGSTDHDRSA